MTFIQDRPRNMLHQIMGYRKSHLVAMELNDYEKNYYANIFDDYLTYIDNGLFEEFTHTMMANGKPVCIFGMRPYWFGVAEFWLVPSVYISKYPIAVVKECRSYLDEMIRQYDLKRLQITVSYHNNTAYKFAKSLYFKKEGVLKKYGPEGADYFMMARFPDE